MLDDVIISFPDSPSRGTLYDFDRGQFTLIRVRQGAVKRRHLSTVEALLADVDRLERSLMAERTKAAPLRFLKLRAVTFDDGARSIEVALDLMHAPSDEPILDKERICETLMREHSAGQGRTCAVEVTPLVQQMSSAGFDPLADRYYQRFHEGAGSGAVHSG